MHQFTGMIYNTISLRFYTETSTYHWQLYARQRCPSPEIYDTMLATVTLMILNSISIHEESCGKITGTHYYDCCEIDLNQITQAWNVSYSDLNPVKWHFTIGRLEWWNTTEYYRSFWSKIKLTQISNVEDIVIQRLLNTIVLIKKTVIMQFD